MSGLVLLWACGGDASSLVDDTASAGGCAEAPVVTYETFGRGFLDENCQSCHASTSNTRYDAPTGAVFDTIEDVAAHRDGILERAAGDEPTMPPLGGTTLDDRVRLEIWITCFLDAEAP